MRAMNNIKHYAISATAITALLNYLGKCPYQEVFQLVSTLTALKLLPDDRSAQASKDAVQQRVDGSHS